MSTNKWMKMINDALGPYQEKLDAERAQKELTMTTSVSLYPDSIKAVLEAQLETDEYVPIWVYSGEMEVGKLLVQRHEDTGLCLSKISIDYGQRGYGTLAMRRFIELGRLEGFTSINGEIAPPDLATKPWLKDHFYEPLGFVVTRLVDGGARFNLKLAETSEP